MRVRKKLGEKSGIFVTFLTMGVLLLFFIVESVAILLMEALGGDVFVGLCAIQW